METKVPTSERERKLTCLQNFKSKKERINFSLHGIATNKQTIKNAFNEGVSRMVNHKENFLSSLLFSSLALCSSLHRNKCRVFLCHKRLRYVELQTLTLIICLGGKKKEPLVGRFENLLSKGVPVTSVI